jgi:hypothetical protein
VASSRRAISRTLEGSIRLNPNRFLRAVSFALAALVLAAALPARAAEEHGGGAGTVYPKDEYPYGLLVNQPLTLSAGLIRLDVPVAFNLSKDQVGKPVFIPAALDFGVTDDLQIGVFHARGICLSGKSNGCNKVYDDIGGRVSLGLFRDPGGQLVVNAAVLAFEFEDVGLDGSIGAAYKRTLGNLALVLGADLAVALNKRDQRLSKEALLLSAEGQFQIVHGLAAFGRIGYQKAIDELAGVDVGYQVPVGVGIEFEPVPRVDVGAELTFPNLLGKDSTSDEREGVVFLRLFI